MGVGGWDRVSRILLSQRLFPALRLPRQGVVSHILCGRHSFPAEFGFGMLPLQARPLVSSSPDSRDSVYAPHFLQSVTPQSH